MSQMSPFLKANIALQLAALVVLIFNWHAWPWSVGLIFASHSILMAVSLWPRSSLLGSNLVRLPEWSAARSEVAITIDDGPDPAVTPLVLQILAEAGAKATFFCIGQRVRAYPEICRDIVRAGHSIENHGDSHHPFSPLFFPFAWRREIGNAQQAITSAAGRSPVFYRAMAGLRNPFLDGALSAMGLQLVSWTRRGFDTHDTDPQSILNRLLHNLNAGDILLLHDAHAAMDKDDKAVILTVLPALLAELQKRRLKTVTLNEAFPNTHSLKISPTPE